jgi:hypothetical protein
MSAEVTEPPRPRSENEEYKYIFRTWPRSESYTTMPTWEMGFGVLSHRRQEEMLLLAPDLKTAKVIGLAKF